jgi:hypothetical protein
MTQQQARLIADAAIRRHHAKTALDESERLGQRQATRDHRKALADAEQQLREAIENVTE